MLVLDSYKLEKNWHCKYMMQFINVYAPKYETAGKFWPIAHNSMIFSLVLMHAIAVGIFTLKKLPLASTLIIPLPVLTLLFNEYCRKRFLPIFIAYPAEVCWYSNAPCPRVYQFLCFYLVIPLFPTALMISAASSQDLTWISVFRCW